MLAQCCLVLNSRIPYYFALMTSGRWLVERDKLDKEVVMSFPLPVDLFEIPITLADIQVLSRDNEWESNVSRLVEKLYNLTEDELVLIDDAINYTLDHFRRKASSEAVARTFRESLEQYVQTAQRTLLNSFADYSNG